MVSGLASQWRRCGAGGLVAAAALSLVLASAPSDAASRRLPHKHAAAARLVDVGNVSAFTPATADPRLAAIFARGAAAGASFRFTPSGSASRRAVTVAIRSRSTARPVGRGNAVDLAQATPATGASTLTPIAYNLGVAVGWKQFSLSGDYSKIDPGVLPGRELMDVGVSYGRGRWSTRLSVGADRNTDNRVLLGPNRAYSLDLGTSYALTRNFDLTGGVRYKSLRDRLDIAGDDDRRDAQSVYLGTAFRF